MKSDTLFYTSPLEKYDPPIGLYSDDEVDQSMVRESLTIDVKRALNELKDRERDVLEEYYGFNGKPKTLGEIANKYGLSSVRIGQIHARAIRILRVNSTHICSPIRHLQYYIAGSFKLPKFHRAYSHTRVERGFKPAKKRLPKVIHLGGDDYYQYPDPDVIHTPKPILKEIKKPPPAYVEPEKPIVRCLNCPNTRVTTDSLCEGCQDLKDRGFELVYYERYLKKHRSAEDYEMYIRRRCLKRERKAEQEKPDQGDGLFSQGFIDKLNEIL